MSRENNSDQGLMNERPNGGDRGCSGGSATSFTTLTMATTRLSIFHLTTLDHGQHQSTGKARGPLSLAPPSVRPYLDPYTQNQSPASSPSSVIVAIISLEGRGGFQKNPWSDDATQTGCLKEFIQNIDWASGNFYSSDVVQLNYFFNI